MDFEILVTPSGWQAPGLAHYNYYYWCGPTYCFTGHLRTIYIRYTKTTIFVHIISITLLYDTAYYAMDDDAWWCRVCLSCCCCCMHWNRWENRKKERDPAAQKKTPTRRIISQRPASCSPFHSIEWHSFRGLIRLVQLHKKRTETPPSTLLPFLPERSSWLPHHHPSLLITYLYILRLFVLIIIILCGVWSGACGARVCVPRWY